MAGPVPQPLPRHFVAPLLAPPLLAALLATAAATAVVAPGGVAPLNTPRRGEYGFLTDFDGLSETVARVRVRQMAALFYIREFQFYDAVQGYSWPPAPELGFWKNGAFGRPVRRSVLAAYIDEIRHAGGRSWLYIQAAATDVGDTQLQHGFIMAGEHMVDQRPLLDAVVPTAAWAKRIAPRWAEFASNMSFSGIHWDTLGTFSKPMAEGTDLAGFLRAAVPILREWGLEQTCNFVDGFGWDPSLLHDHGPGGRIISFPYWETWTLPSQEDFFFNEVVPRNNTHGGGVFVCYPGKTVDHMGEMQNQNAKGIWPMDLMIKRWRKALRHGSTYLAVGDGVRHVQTQYFPATAAISSEDVKKIVRKVFGNYTTTTTTPATATTTTTSGLRNETGNDTTTTSTTTPFATVQLHGNAVQLHGESQHLIFFAIRGHGSGARLYRRSLGRRPPRLGAGGWELASESPVKSVAVKDDVLYGVNLDLRVCKQSLGELSRKSEWKIASSGVVSDIAIAGDTIYGIGPDRRIWKQRLSSMTPSSDWDVAGAGPMKSIATTRHTLYAVGADSKIYRQAVASMHPLSAWEQAADGGVEAIAIRGDVIFGVTRGNEIRSQLLQSMGNCSNWSLALRGADATAIAVVPAAPVGCQGSAASGEVVCADSAGSVQFSRTSVPEGVLAAATSPLAYGSLLALLCGLAVALLLWRPLSLCGASDGEGDGSGGCCGKGLSRSRAASAASLVLSPRLAPLKSPRDMLAQLKSPRDMARYALETQGAAPGPVMPRLDAEKECPLLESTGLSSSGADGDDGDDVCCTGPQKSTGAASAAKAGAASAAKAALQSLARWGGRAPNGAVPVGKDKP